MEPSAAEASVRCVLLPCSSGETLAVPLNSFAEVVTGGEVLSGRLHWRGHELPVYPPSAAQQDNAIHAVMLGLGELAGDYWAISLQNRSLQYRLLTESDLVEPTASDTVTADALAVFALAGTTCVVPDLGALQTSLAAGPGHCSR